jgi:hypothetical protein
MNEILLSVYLWCLTDRGQNLLAGLAGSLVAVLLEWGSMGSNLRRFFVGTATAVYAGPAGVPLFEWAFVGLSLPESTAPSFGVFMMGVSGVVVMEVFTRTLRLWQRKGTQNREKE